MGTGNAAVKQWMSNRGRFADLYNGYMLYDSMTYVEQMKQLWEVHKEENMTDEEFLSKFRKEDKLSPVITLVFYYAEKKWDGSTELYEMFGEDVAEQAEVLKKYVANYRINLVDAGHLDKLEVFKTDLQEILGMLQCRGTKAELVHYVNGKADYFRNVDEETYYAIREFLHSDKIWKKEIKMKEGEGNINMCQALEELYNDGRAEGYDAGKNEGIATGEREHLLKLIRRKLAKGKTIEEIADALEEEVSTIRKLIRELETAE